MLPSDFTKLNPEKMTDDELKEASELCEGYSSYWYDMQGRYDRELFYRKNPECRITPPESGEQTK